MNKRQRKKYYDGPITSYREERKENRLCHEESVKANRKAKALIAAGIKPRNKYEEIMVKMYNIHPKHRNLKVHKYLNEIEKTEHGSRTGG